MASSFGRTSCSTKRLKASRIATCVSSHSIMPRRVARRAGSRAEFTEGRAGLIGELELRLGEAGVGGAEALRQHLDQAPEELDAEVRLAAHQVHHVALREGEDARRLEGSH